MIFKWLAKRKFNKLKREHALTTYNLLMRIKEHNDEYGWHGACAWMCCQEPAADLKVIYGKGILRELNGKWCKRLTGVGTDEVFPISRAKEHTGITKFSRITVTYPESVKAEVNFRKDLWHFWYNELVDGEALNEQRK